jgi:peptide/nickel transport system substrate-binding protein
MRWQRKGTVLAVPVVAVAMLATACGGSGGSGGGSGGSGGNNASSGGNGGGTSSSSLKARNISKTPRDQVKDGGTITWALDQFSTQWNYNQLNGPESSTDDVISALMPRLFKASPDGEVSVNKNYLTSAKITNKSPETVTYEINPKATWSDGTPITYKDFATQWKALNGSNSKYEVASSTGYKRIGSVKEGKNPKEVIVTFTKPFGEWQSIFDPLYPAKYQKTPKLFNSAYKNKIPVTAGPFKLKGIDKSTQTVTVVRNPKWWGPKTKLDEIVFKAEKENAALGAFANGEIDFIKPPTTGSALKRIKGTPGATIHKAAGPDYRQITFNGKSDMLGNVKVRRAVAMAINRKAITKADLQGLGWPVVTMGNHFLVNTQKGYQDNSGAVGKYNPGKAKKMLSAVGWKMQGKFRQKNGKTLALNFIIPAGLKEDVNESHLVSAMEKQVGVKVNIKTVPSSQYFDKYVSPGKFDLTIFSWLGTPFPVSGAKSIYQKPTNGNVRQNYARIGSDKIDNLMNKAIADLNERQAHKDANKADKLIWQEVHSVVLYQRPQITATSKGLVNIGSAGLAGRQQHYANIGFKK